MTIPEWCVRTLLRLAEELSECDDSSLHFNLLDAQRVQLELLFRELVAVESFGGVAIGRVREALSILQSVAEQHQQGDSDYRAPLTIDGRPAFYIPCHQLAYLLENRFTCSQIANILGISLRTVRRRMTEFSLATRMYYTDEQLDEIVCEIQHAFPTCGNSQMQGHLISRGIRVQQQRFRESTTC